MAWTTNPKVMDLRERSGAIDVAVETFDGWTRHQSGRNASLLSFFTFLSIFPLMLAATTILGFVLDGNPELRARVIDSALSDIPVLGQQLAENPDGLSGSVLALVIGVLTALWSSTKAFVGLQSALDDTWEIPVFDRAAMPVQRAKALLGIVILGGAQLGSIVIAAIVDRAGLPLVGNLALVLGTVAINVAVISAMYRFLTSAQPSWDDVIRGGIVAGIIFTLLQNFGTRIVTQITERAGKTYGQYALVLGIVTWMGFIAITTLMCAEYNAARVRLQREPQVSDDPVFDIPITA